MHRLFVVALALGAALASACSRPTPPDVVWEVSETTHAEADSQDREEKDSARVQPRFWDETSTNVSFEEQILFEKYATDASVDCERFPAAFVWELYPDDPSRFNNPPPLLEAGYQTDTLRLTPFPEIPEYADSFSCDLRHDQEANLRGTYRAWDTGDYIFGCNGYRIWALFKPATDSDVALPMSLAAIRHPDEPWGRRFQKQVGYAAEHTQVITIFWQRRNDPLRSIECAMISGGLE